MKRYKYRILKEKAYSDFTIERKPLGLMSLFEPWLFVAWKETVPEAEAACLQFLENDKKPPSDINKGTILIKEFYPDEYDD